MVSNENFSCHPWLGFLIHLWQQFCCLPSYACGWMVRDGLSHLLSDMVYDCWGEWDEMALGLSRFRQLKLLHITLKVLEALKPRQIPQDKHFQVGLLHVCSCQTGWSELQAKGQRQGQRQRDTSQLLSVTTTEICDLSYCHKKTKNLNFNKLHLARLFSSKWPLYFFINNS